MKTGASQGGRTPRSHDLVLRTIQEHAGSLLRVARRYSYCADDAQDAYQRALEIFLRRVDSLEPDGMAAWLRTVVKHEALAVRAARSRQIAGTEIDFDAREAEGTPTDDERVEGFVLLERSAEALKGLKPQEVRALLLKAQGHSYQEICELTDWSYTKVNRCLTEGRRSFLDRCADIESGRECERWAPLLSSLADGEASAKDVTRLRPHLRHCPACRARLGEYRRSPRNVAALVPVAALAPASDGTEATSSLLARLYEAITGGLHERAALSAQRVQSTLDAAASGKVAAVAASAAALAGGGVAVTGAAGNPERQVKDTAALERKAPPAPSQPVASPRSVLLSRSTAAGSTDRKSAAGTRSADRDQARRSGAVEFAPEPIAVATQPQPSGGASGDPTKPSPSASVRGPGEFEP